MNQRQSQPGWKWVVVNTLKSSMRTRPSRPCCLSGVGTFSHRSIPGISARLTFLHDDRLDKTIQKEEKSDFIAVCMVCQHRVSRSTHLIASSNILLHRCTLNLAKSTYHVYRHKVKPVRSAIAQREDQQLKHVSTWVVLLRSSLVLITGQAGSLDLRRRWLKV